MNSIEIIERLLHNQLVFRLRVFQFILALAIFTFAALMPSGYVPAVGSDHSLHFVGNILLFLSASAALLRRAKLGLIALVLAPYSLLIEASQWLTPNRQVDIADAGVNLTGLAVGWLLALLVDWVWQRVKAAVPPRSQVAGKTP